MLQPLNTENQTDIVSLLRKHGIQPTSQRILITRLMLERHTHLSAEEVFRLVNASDKQVSKATVYNTLGLLTEKGVIREVIADPNRVFYDPNTSPHHHFFDVESGALQDIDAAEVQVTKLPPLPEGADLDRVDVIVRLRRK
jgi:Fur family iron response transcriptional regulator